MSGAAEMSPLISVVVSVYNGEPFIGECIASLLAMDSPPGAVEIIVVDNNSTDRTRDIIAAYPVIMHHEKVQGASAARHAGVMISRGRIIACTDADCVVDTGWASAIEKTFDDPAIDAAIGFADGIDENIHARFAQKRWEESWFRRTENGLILRHNGIDTRNCAIRKNILLRCGSFDPSAVFCADLHLSLRLNAKKCRIVFAPTMIVWHKNPTSFAQIMDKSDKQLAVVMDMLRTLPPTLDDHDIPFPKSAFYGMAERRYGCRSLAMAIFLLAMLRSMILGVTRFLMALKLDNPVTFKLYKVFFGIAYDLAILRDRRKRARL